MFCSITHILLYAPSNLRCTKRNPLYHHEQRKVIAVNMCYIFGFFPSSRQPHPIDWGLQTSHKNLIRTLFVAEILTVSRQWCMLHSKEGHLCTHIKAFHQKPIQKKMPQRLSMFSFTLRRISSGSNAILFSKQT